MNNLKTFEGFVDWLIDKTTPKFDKVDMAQKVVDKNRAERERKLSEQYPDFSNLGHDEEGNLIGNCKKCGSNGTLVGRHKC